MNSALISVVIPTYNRAHLVCDALNSVAAQCYRPIEIIVVDDGSSDETESIVKNWNSRLSGRLTSKYFRQHNLGGNVARNKGIEMAQGEFIAFLDSDDTWFTEKLTQQAAILAKYPDCGAVYCGLQEIEVGSTSVSASPQREFPQGDILDQLLVRDITGPTSTFLIRSGVLDLVGRFDERLQARQDWDLWIRIAEVAEIRAVPKILVNLRNHSGPRTISDPSKELAAYKSILAKYSAQRRSQGYRTQLAALASYHRRTGRVNLHHTGARMQALWHYLLAIAIWPFAADSYAALLGWFLPTGLKRYLRSFWNQIFGATVLAIRSH